MLAIVLVASLMVEAVGLVPAMVNSLARLRPAECASTRYGSCSALGGADRLGWIGVPLRAARAYGASGGGDGRGERFRCGGFGVRPSRPAAGASRRPPACVGWEAAAIRASPAAGRP